MVKVGRTFGGVNADAGILRLFYEILPDSERLYIEETPEIGGGTMLLRDTEVAVFCLQVFMDEELFEAISRFDSYILLSGPVLTQDDFRSWQEDNRMFVYNALAGHIWIG